MAAKRRKTLPRGRKGAGAYRRAGDFRLAFDFCAFLRLKGLEEISFSLFRARSFFVA
jgi:hypothetical protein